MAVNSAAQAKYRVFDGSGGVHFVECFMCALQLVNDYDSLNISTYCDWYGPNYEVTVASSQFGGAVTVTPTTAMFLNGGSCVINRVAFNQSAADELLANGYSKFTLPEQHYDLPTDTKVSTVTQAILNSAENKAATSPIAPIVAAAFVGVVIIALSVLAYKKFRFTKN